MRKEISQNVSELVAEYKADPNCRPELWISSETVTSEEREQFLELTKNNSSKSKMFYVTPIGADCDRCTSNSGYCFYSKVNAEKCADNLNSGSDGQFYPVTNEPVEGFDYWWAGVFSL